MEQKILSLLVANQFGVLTKVTSLFGRRGYNIKSLSVGETENPALSRITIVTEGDALLLEQIYKQVSKLEVVVTVEILSGDLALERELILVKVQPETMEQAGLLMQLVTDARAKSAASQDCMIVEATGTASEMDTLIKKLEPFGIVELSRTGTTAMSRSNRPLHSGLGENGNGKARY